LGAAHRAIWRRFSLSTHVCNLAALQGGFFVEFSATANKASNSVPEPVIGQDVRRIAHHVQYRALLDQHERVCEKVCHSCTQYPWNRIKPLGSIRFEG
jgi:hypothetical protein